MELSRLWTDLQRGIGPLFACSKRGDYLQIHTPYLFPDGDCIDVFCRIDGDVITVTDLAVATGWLRMQSIALRRTSKQNQLIGDVCMTLGIEFYRGMLQAHCRSGDQLAATVMRVAQAAVRVSDLWFTLRPRAASSITDDVAGFLTKRQYRFECAQMLTGKSGRTWKIHFQVRTKSHNSLVQVLSTKSRAVARRVSERALAVWHDLYYLSEAPRAPTFVSLFDDSFDVWDDRDYRLIESVSTVSRWSQPNEFATILSVSATHERTVNLG